MSYVPPTPPPLPPAVTGALVNDVRPYISTPVSNVAHHAQEAWKAITNAIARGGR
ncbi:hypothetical protein ACWCYZ_28765 [Streptomyces virginiae]